MNTPTITVTLPPRFYDDHVDRDLPAGKVIKETKKATTVELTAADYDELLSDAQHYADPASGFGNDPWALGLRRSAQATVERLLAVERPDDPDVVLVPTIEPGTPVRFVGGPYGILSEQPCRFRSEVVRDGDAGVYVGPVEGPLADDGWQYVEVQRGWGQRDGEWARPQRFQAPALVPVHRSCIRVDHERVAELERQAEQYADEARDLADARDGGNL